MTASTDTAYKEQLISPTAATATMMTYVQNGDDTNKIAVYQSEPSSHTISRGYPVPYKVTDYSKRKQIFATLSATIGCLVNGCVIGYSAPGIFSMMRPGKGNLTIYETNLSITLQQSSWIVSFLSLGGFIGYLMARPITEKIGRKKSLTFVSNFLFLAGNLFIFFANHFYIICLGRFICGVALGFQLYASFVYIAEISSGELSKVLSCFIQLMGSLGVLISFVLGSVLEWPYLALAATFFTPFILLAMCSMPESPRWLILRGHEYQAFVALEWLRGRNDKAIDEEIDIIKKEVTAKTAMIRRISIVQLGSIWKQFLLSLLMVFIFQFSGFNVMIYYTVNIFAMTGSKMKPDINSISFAFFLLLASFVSYLVKSRFRRKPVLIISLFGMALCQFTLGYCVYVTERSQQQLNATFSKSNSTYLFTGPPSPLIVDWIPLMCLLIFVFVGTSGYGTLVWVVVCEILPSKTRSVTDPLITSAAFLSGFIMSKCFIDLFEHIGGSGTFWFMGSVAFLGAFFIWILVPETSGVSSEEIENWFFGSRYYARRTLEASNSNAIPMHDIISD